MDEIYTTISQKKFEFHFFPEGLQGKWLSNFLRHNPQQSKFTWPQNMCKAPTD